MIIVDGMMSGTGIRNGDIGGYIKHEELGLSVDLSDSINYWLEEYTVLHRSMYQNKDAIKRLDDVGLMIARRVRNELPHQEVKYYSDALMTYIDF